MPGSVCPPGRHCGVGWPSVSWCGSSRCYSSSPANTNTPLTPSAAITVHLHTMSTSVNNNCCVRQQTFFKAFAQRPGQCRGSETGCMRDVIEARHKAVWVYKVWKKSSGWRLTQRCDGCRQEMDCTGREGRKRTKLSRVDLLHKQ